MHSNKYSSQNSNVLFAIDIKNIERRDERIFVDVQLTGWLKIELTNTEEQAPSFFRNGFGLARKSKDVQYKNHRELMRYTFLYLLCLIIIKKTAN